MCLCPPSSYPICMRHKLFIVAEGGRTSFKVRSDHLHGTTLSTSIRRTWRSPVDSLRPSGILLPSSGLAYFLFRASLSSSKAWIQRQQFAPPCPSWETRMQRRKKLSTTTDLSSVLNPHHGCYCLLMHMCGMAMVCPLALIQVRPSNLRFKFALHQS